jgi:manganese-dependent inorganic pyrophosphatase
MTIGATQTVLVIGHHHPDTDAVCSALAYASFYQIILTDHNHPEQAAPGVAESQIVAIVDHHNLGGLQTLQPLSIHCEPVGSTCTLIAELYRQTGAPLEPTLVGAIM